MHVIDKILWRVSELFLFGETFPDEGDFYVVRLVTSVTHIMPITPYVFIPVQVEKRLHLGWRLFLGDDERLTAPITPRFKCWQDAVNTFAKEKGLGEDDFKIISDSLVIITDGKYAGSILQFRPM